MTRQECEQAIVKKLREIWDIYQEYAPGDDGLTVFVTEHAACVFNQQSLDGGEKPLDRYEIAEEVRADDHE